MKVALIHLPENNILVDSVFTNLNHFWIPPKEVITFWNRGCLIEYMNDIDYENTKIKILNSYQECISQHYREFVY